MRCPRKYAAEDVIILRRAKMLNGDTAILYIEKNDTTQLKRITIKEEKKK